MVVIYYLQLLSLYSSIYDGGASLLLVAFIRLWHSPHLESLLTFHLFFYYCYFASRRVVDFHMEEVFVEVDEVMMHPFYCYQHPLVIIVLSSQQRSHSAVVYHHLLIRVEQDFNRLVRDLRQGMFLKIHLFLYLYQQIEVGHFSFVDGIIQG